ncbi:hypothetical protein IGS73_07530 [Janibacter indicus]|uniref:Uncharacterized protein n=1 Tax=Janibacter indicus TaxID=857417 RepID=A0A7L9J630_9MICO|nr:hypothetical protein [Janibacter indicus]QOK24200.1 hypothetical protein IGS73_07530 [Janibacter indicus]
MVELWTAWSLRHSPAQARLPLGWALFLLSPGLLGLRIAWVDRPLRSRTAGLVLLVIALSAWLIWLDRSELTIRRFRDQLVPGVMFMLWVALPPLGLYMMICQPESPWEKEIREAEENSPPTTTNPSR